MEQSLGQNTPLSGCTFPARGMVRFRRWGEHVAMYVRSTTPYGEKMHRAQGKGKHTRPTLAVESTVQDRLITHAHTKEAISLFHFINFSSFIHSFIHSFKDSDACGLGWAVDSGPDGCMHDSVLQGLTRIIIFRLLFMIEPKRKNEDEWLDGIHLG